MVFSSLGLRVCPITVDAKYASEINLHKSVCVDFLSADC